MVLSWLWQDKDAELRETLRMVPGKLDSDADIDRFLRQNYPMGDVDAMIRIRTGIYLQSLEFKNDTDVKITGYIWQAYKDGTNDRYLPAEGEAGFILPDQVDAGDALQPRLDYHIHQGDEELFGWYVEATLREAFEYIKFPFDHKIVSVRIWPRDFTTNVIPVPDFDAYEAQTSDIFGIKEGIVIPRWTPESSPCSSSPRPTWSRPTSCSRSTARSTSLSSSSSGSECPRDCGTPLQRNPPCSSVIRAWASPPWSTGWFPTPTGRPGA